MRRSGPWWAVWVILAACGAEDPTGGLPPGDAQLAVLNALTTSLAPSAILVLDGSQINLPTLGGRSSRAIASGAHRLELRNAATLLATADFVVSDGGKRSAVVGGGANGTISLLVAADTASLPPSDAAKIRVVNTVSGLGPLEALLHLTSAAPDSAAHFVSPFSYGVGTSGEFPGYAVRPPGTYRVAAVDPVSGDVVAEATVTIGAGQVFSAVLTSTLSGTVEFVVIREL